MQQKITNEIAMILIQPIKPKISQIMAIGRNQNAKTILS
jgi:hypothetical protein